MAGESMLELPEIEVYLSCLAPRILGEPLEKARVKSFFLVRTFDPPISAAEGRTVEELFRLGKRIVYAEREMNYCAHCQTGGKVLADRSLSRLLKDTSIEELEQG